MSNLKNQILQKIQEGKTYKEISEQLGCGKGTIAFHVKNSNLKPAKKNNKILDNLNWNTIQKYYDSGYSIRECCKIFNFSNATWYKAIQSGYIIPRESEIPNDQILCKNSQYKTKMVRRRILRDNLIPYKCNKCGLEDIWDGERLVLQLDHINGISNDHRLENLRFLCPNCHSQTETFSRRKIPTQKFNNEQVIEIKKALKNGKTIYSLCKKYNATFTTITCIRDKKTYKYIEDIE